MSGEIIVGIIAGVAAMIGAMVEYMRAGRDHWELAQRVAKLEEKVSVLEKK